MNRRRQRRSRGGRHHNQNHQGDDVVEQRSAVAVENGANGSVDSSTEISRRVDEVNIDANGKIETQQYCDEKRINKSGMPSSNGSTKQGDAAVPLTSKTIQEHYISKPPATTTVNQLPDTQYADFTFWKPLLPPVDSEIAALLHNSDSAHRKPTAETVTSRHQSTTLLTSSAAVHRRFDDASGREAKFTTEYNEFNFWRTPIADIDLDLSRILLSNER